MKFGFSIHNNVEHPYHEFCEEMEGQGNPFFSKTEIILFHMDEVFGKKLFYTYPLCSSILEKYGKDLSCSISLETFLA